VPSFICQLCGKEKIVEFPRDAKRMKFCSRSCGTSFKNTKNAKQNGMSNSKIYSIWVGMKRRCNYEKHSNYGHYGARGIKVCDRWLDFQNFYADMGDIPFPDAQLDRIDNNGNYEQGNCHWVTPAENNQNKRSNVIVEINGKNVCLAVACREIGVDYYTLKNRRNRWGITSQEAVDSFINEKP